MYMRLTLYRTTLSVELELGRTFASPVEYRLILLAALLLKFIYI